MDLPTSSIPSVLPYLNVNDQEGNFFPSSPLDFAAIHMLGETTACMSEDNGEEGVGVKGNRFALLDFNELEESRKKTNKTNLKSSRNTMELI